MATKIPYRKPYFEAPLCPGEVSSMDKNPCTNVKEHEIARLVIKRKDAPNPFAATPFSDQVTFDTMNAETGAKAVGWTSLLFDYDFTGGIQSVIDSNNGRRRTSGSTSLQEMVVRFSNLDVTNESSLWVSINDNAENLECYFITESGTILSLPGGEGGTWVPIIHARLDRGQYTGQNSVHTLTLSFHPEVTLQLIQSDPTPVDWLGYDF